MLRGLNWFIYWVRSSTLTMATKRSCQRISWEC